MENKRVTRILLIGPAKGGGVFSVHNEVRNLLSKVNHLFCYTVYNDAVSGNIKVKKVIKYLKLYAKIILKIFYFKPNVIYLQLSQSGFLHQSFILIIGYILGKKTIAHFHAKPDVPRSENRFNRKIIISGYLYVDQLIVLTKTSKMSLQKHGWKKPIHVIPNFVDTSNYPIKIKPINERKFDVIYVGRMHRDKGIFEILNIANFLKNRSFIFIGYFHNKSDEKEFKQKINKMKNIIWKGPIYDKKKFYYLADAKIFLLPTKHEGEVFPMSMIESLLCGVIPLVHPIGSIPDIIKDGFNGKYIEVDCPKETSKVIDSFLENRNLLKEMSKRCELTSKEKYSAEAVKKEILNIIAVLSPK